MIYSIVHHTTYSYNALVNRGHNMLHLTPRDTPGQRLIYSQIKVTPDSEVQWAGRDFFGNKIHFLALEQPHDTLKISAASRVDVHPDERLLPHATTWEQVRDQVHQDKSEDMLKAYQYTFDSPQAASHVELKDMLKGIFLPNRSLIEALVELNQTIFSSYKYDQTATHVATPVMDVYRQKAGVCQDFAHLMIAALRVLGLPARYVSGYLRTSQVSTLTERKHDHENGHGKVMASVPQVQQANGQRHEVDAQQQQSQQQKQADDTDPPLTDLNDVDTLIGNDASHAWVSVFHPAVGWLDFDPTNNVQPGRTGTNHITLAWGRDYADVAPIKGVILGSGSHNVSVAVEVIPESLR